MSKMKTIGIIGGMGPMATVDLMKKVILATDAREDQDHIPILVDNNTNIPDRVPAEASGHPRQGREPAAGAHEVGEPPDGCRRGLPDYGLQYGALLPTAHAAEPPHPRHQHDRGDGGLLCA